MSELNFPGNQMFTNQQNNLPEKTRPNQIVGRDSVVSTKPSVGKRLFDSFFREDIVNSVIIPGVQNLILDGLEMMFFHRFSGRNMNYNYPPQSYGYNTTFQYGNGYGYNYSQPYQYQNQQSNFQQPQPPKNTVDYKNIILRTKQDAEAVVREIQNRITSFGSCSVADLLDLIGVPGEYTDNNWGWRDARYIGIRRVSTGFLIVVPDVQPLNI